MLDVPQFITPISYQWAFKLFTFSYCKNPSITNIAENVSVYLQKYTYELNFKGCVHFKFQ